MDSFEINETGNHIDNGEDPIASGILNEGGSSIGAIDEEQGSDINNEQDSSSSLSEDEDEDDEDEKTEDDEQDTTLPSMEDSRDEDAIIEEEVLLGSTITPLTITSTSTPSTAISQRRKRNLSSSDVIPPTLKPKQPESSQQPSSLTTAASMKTAEEQQKPKQLTPQQIEVLHSKDEEIQRLSKQLETSIQGLPQSMRDIELFGASTGTHLLRTLSPNAESTPTGTSNLIPLSPISRDLPIGMTWDSWPLISEIPIGNDGQTIKLSPISQQQSSPQFQELSFVQRIPRSELHVFGRAPLDEPLELVKCLQCGIVIRSIEYPQHYEHCQKEDTFIDPIQEQMSISPSATKGVTSHKDELPTKRRKLENVPINNNKDKIYPQSPNEIEVKGNIIEDRAMIELLNRAKSTHPFPIATQINPRVIRLRRLFHSGIVMDIKITGTRRANAKAHNIQPSNTSILISAQPKQPKQRKSKKQQLLLLSQNAGNQQQQTTISQQQQQQQPSIALPLLQQQSQPQQTTSDLRKTITQISTQQQQQQHSQLYTFKTPTQTPFQQQQQIQMQLQNQQINAGNLLHSSQKAIPTQPITESILQAQTHLQQQQHLLTSRPNLPTGFSYQSTQQPSLSFHQNPAQGMAGLQQPAGRGITLNSITQTQRTFTQPVPQQPQLQLQQNQQQQIQLQQRPQNQQIPPGTQAMFNSQRLVTSAATAGMRTIQQQQQQQLLSAINPTRAIFQQQISQSQQTQIQQQQQQQQKQQQLHSNVSSLNFIRQGMPLQQLSSPSLQQQIQHTTVPTSIVQQGLPQIAQR